MAASKSTPAPPEVIAGRYKIETKLGQGGMGSVWRAQHLSLRSPVAIKLIDPSLAQSEEAVARFLREAQAAASLRSPHVVQILDHGVDQGVPYIAMELLEGESLADRLTRIRKLSPAETARVMTHVARAMGLAHATGIVHRDLKPDNIFLVRNDDEEITKVLDFGIAKATANAFDVTTGTRTGAMLGTPYYMSPEQVEGSKGIDHRTDLWAMAVIAFECLTEVKPFDGDTLGALLLKICSKAIPVPSQVAEVPAGFDAWFARATERAPADRFQSAREMAEALRAVLIPGAAAQALLATPTRGTVNPNPPAKDAVPGTGNSGTVIVDAWAAPEPRESSIHPAGVPRRGRMLPTLITVGCVVLLVAAALLFGRSSDEPRAADAADKEQPHLVVPDQARQVVPDPPANAAVVAAPVAPPSPPAAPAAPAPAAAQPPVVRPPAKKSEAAKPRPTAVTPTPHTVAAPIPSPSRPARPKPASRPTDLGF